MTFTIIHKDYERNVALVKNDKTGKSFPVHIAHGLKFLICVGDYAIVKKSPVSGEWYLTDYVRFIDNEVEA